VTHSGLTLDVRYRLEERIAAGGVGQVWRGRDLLLLRPVAIKLLRPEYSGHPQALERLRAEARHAGRLSHPCIAQVHDYCDGGPDASPYLVMAGGGRAARSQGARQPGRAGCLCGRDGTGTSLHPCGSQGKVIVVSSRNCRNRTKSIIARSRDLVRTDASEL
jgi:hypothetical protein